MALQETVPIQPSGPGVQDDQVGDHAGADMDSGTRKGGKGRPEERHPGHADRGKGERGRDTGEGETPQEGASRPRARTASSAHLDAARQTCILGPALQRSEPSSRQGRALLASLSRRQARPRGGDPDAVGRGEGPGRPSPSPERRRRGRGPERGASPLGGAGPAFPSALGRRSARRDL